MAERKTTNKATTQKEVKEILADSKIDNKKMEEPIKDTPSIEDLMVQIAELKKQVLQNKTVGTKAETASEEPSEKMIKFISLARGSVMLKGTAKRPYEIEGRFNDRWFSESEAKAIVNLMGNYMREGFVYIDDANFVKSVGLAEVYKTMLTPDILKNLFDQSPSSVVNIYQNATEGQQRIILDMLYEKKNNGEQVDANILMQIGKIAGMDLISDFEE